MELPTNIASPELKGLVEGKLLWILWSWCMAHRPSKMPGMLLNLYFLYAKLPEKYRQLEDVITDLKEWPYLADGRSKPVRTSGSRWIGNSGMQ